MSLEYSSFTIFHSFAVLPTLSKIFERHIARQIFDFLSKYDLLHHEQSGFRQFHSCLTALTELTDNWLKQMDEGNLTGVTRLDFSKAFDLVNHDILLQKLRCYNFDNTTHKLFCSYLTDRYQSVYIRVVNEYPVNRLTVERTEYRLVKLVLGYSVKKYKYKQNVANIKIRSV